MATERQANNDGITFLNEKVYFFENVMRPCPPGTPATPRPADKPRILPGSSEDIQDSPPPSPPTE